jgi:hypothetical protein
MSASLKDGTELIDHLETDDEDQEKIRVVHKETRINENVNKNDSNGNKDKNKTGSLAAD